ncbi:MAG: hypothetical protein JKX98_12520 [Alcanivoracaceae bacterium]|nr:hypothetical protein [Alcanivoracaceae bacterium]
MLIDTSVIITLSIVAIILVSFFYIPDLHFGLNLGDEGYLWFGTQQVIERKIPIRDFRAYDPGRYYWMVPWFLLFGKNIISLRIAQNFTQCITLFIGLIFIYLYTNNVVLSVLLGLSIVPWLIPRHKQIDILFSVMTPFALLLTLQSPEFSHFFILGLYLGICMLFGLNHVLYASISLILVLILLEFKGQQILTGNNLTALFSGFTLFLIPIFLLFIFIPRLFSSYWQKKILRIVKRRHANLRLPLPWLWNKNTPQLNSLTVSGQIFIKIVFTSMPFIYIWFFFQFLNTLDLTSQSITNLVLASCGLMYFHHASSRADISHIAQSLLPYTLLLINSSDSIWIYLLLVSYILFSFKFIYWENIEWPKYLINPNNYSKLKLNTASIFIPSNQSLYVNIVKNLVCKYSKKNDHVVLLPNIVTFYPLLERKPAIYDIFSVYAPSDDEQDEMIVQMKTNKPSFLLINNVAIDGRKKLEFINSHNKVWAYIQNNFYQIENNELPQTHFAFRPIN